MPVALAHFRVDQRRKRQLYTDAYSHVAVAFPDGLILVETSRARDYAVAAAHRLPVPVPHGGLARRLVRMLPTYGGVEAVIEAMDAVTPERLAQAFPGRVRRVSARQIVSAVLRPTRPAELKIVYDSRAHGKGMELWLGLPRGQERAAVSRAMQAMLGDRYAETGTGLVDQLKASAPVVQDVGDAALSLGRGIEHR